MKSCVSTIRWATASLPLNVKKHHENELCQKESCDQRSCRKRHPKVCKYFSQGNICKFGKDCGYDHKENDKNVKLDQFNLLVKETNNMKAEIEVLKNTIATLASIKQEGKLLKHSVDLLKDEIRHIRSENGDIIKKIKTLEEDLRNENDEESEEGSNDEQDLYQIEIINYEMVWACNLCDTGFDTKDEIKQHMSQDHEKVLDVADNDMKEYEAIGNKEDFGENKEIQKEGEIEKIICKLCNVGHDGNTEVKEHFVKEHMQITKVSNTVEDCGYIFCMDIQKDKCSHFFIFYKNFTKFEGEFGSHEEKGGSGS